MASFVDSRLDLSRLPVPAAVETLDFETVYAAIKASFLADYEARRLADPTLPAIDTDGMESQLLAIVLEQFAYRELLLRARVNDAVRSVLLAHSTGTDLDNLAANYGVTRADGELDSRLRLRMQLAWGALSTAGTYEGYTFHAFDADPRVADVAVWGPESGFVDPGQSLVTILSSEGLGAPSSDLLEAVTARLQDRGVRALTDEVIVEGATVLPYVIEAKLKVGRVPSPELLRLRAQSRLEGLVSKRAIGRRVSLSSIYGALHLTDDSGSPIISEVVLLSPVADVTPTARQVATCTTISVSIELIE